MLGVTAMNIMLYTGPDCHLCDQAKALIKPLVFTYRIELIVRNVRENHEWYHLYGARIPVLTTSDGSRLLAWPFTSDDIEQFLQ